MEERKRERERQGANGVERQPEGAAVLPSCREWGIGEREC